MSSQTSGTVITHREVVRFEQAARGAFEDVDYTPTFRSSAIFFAWVGRDVDTVVSFMNYWRVKNGNEAVTALITLRDADGRRLWRNGFAIRESTYQFSVRELVEGVDFAGSLEVEFFSTQDLKFPYPALEVFYHTAQGVSFVHANQRVFNNVEDMDRTAPMNPWQTGFDIAITSSQTAYVTLINGPRLVRQSVVDLKIYNARGEVMDAKIALGDLPAYAARLLVLDREVPGLARFLGSEYGFCKVNFDVFGVFLRVACGIMARNQSCIEVTHSYYDCAAHQDYYEQAVLKSGEYGCFIPVNVLDDMDVDLVYYPIYAKSRLHFSLDRFSAEGQVLASIERVATLDATGTRMLRLDLRRVMAEHGWDGEAGLYCVSIESADGRIPARIAVGLNYRNGMLGCNINSSMVMAPSYGIRKRLYLWGALMWKSGGENRIVISHLSKVKGAQERGALTLRLFGTQGAFHEQRYETSNGTALDIQVEPLVVATGYAPREGEVIWYTLESSCPNYLSNQLHISRSGFVGGDHSF